MILYRSSLTGTKVLLFIFWYCHKRGKEVRLEKERLLTESEIAALDDGAPVTSSNGPPMTTAPPGAPIGQIEAGMREAELVEQQQRGGTGQYAEGGSLAEDRRREEHGKKAGEPMSSHVAHTMR